MPLKANWTDGDASAVQHAQAHNDAAAAINLVTVNVQIFTALTGTWTKPPGAQSVDVIVVGGGTGGGSGRRGAAGTVRQGGGGGSSGGTTRQQLPAAVLPATCPITVGQGLAGGAAVTADNTDGNPSTGTIYASHFNYIVRAGQSQTIPATQGGGSGAGGTGANYGHGLSAGYNGATAPTNGGAGAAAALATSGAGGGGGAGGGLSAANLAYAGGAGGGVPMVSAINTIGGAVDGAPPAPGAAMPANSGLPGAGGGGGAASLTQAGQDGSNGGLYGAGGGGGGASVNGFPSGKGGDGAPGIVIVTTYCAPG